MNHGILYLDNKNGETSILVGKAENDLFPENSPILNVSLPNDHYLLFQLPEI